jgi:hypothetical protein
MTPTQPKPEDQDASGRGTASLSSFFQEAAQLHLAQQESLAILKLAAYATDAMRVLWVLERHADMSPPLDATLKAICPDWKNPGAIEHPADLIVVALNGAIYAMQRHLNEADRLVEVWRHQ